MAKDKNIDEKQFALENIERNMNSNTKVNNLIVTAITNSIWKYIQEGDVKESDLLRFIETEITGIFTKYGNVHPYYSHIKRMSKSMSEFILNQYESFNKPKVGLTAGSVFRWFSIGILGSLSIKEKEVLKEKFFQEFEQYVRKLYAEIPKERYKKDSERTLSGEELFKQVKPSVVGIATEVVSGSGVFYKPDGIIVTNRHVVGNATEVTVRLHNSEEFPGKVMHSFRDIDLALVKVFIHGVKILYPKTSDVTEEGQTIYAIGHPDELTNTITKGTISSVGRIMDKVKYIQHDAAVNPGNSGGPLFNENAKLIGINTLERVKMDGIGFALPIKMDGIGFALPTKYISEKYAIYQNLPGDPNNREYCPVCGHSSVEHSKYCENCGVNLEQYKESSGTKTTAFVLRDICSCGQARSANEKYCENCGQNLSIQKTEE